MKKNKLFFLLIASMLSLASLTGCNSNDNGQANQSSSAGSNSNAISSSDNGNSTSQPSQSSSDSQGGNTSSNNPGNQDSDSQPISSSQPGGNSEGQGSESEPISSSEPGSNSAGQDSDSQPSNSSEGQGENDSQGQTGEGGDETATDWTEEQKNLMKENLYGVVLPFISVPLVLRKETYTSVSQLTFYGNEAEIPAGTLNRYAELFTEEDGWIGGDISYTEGLSNGIIYSFNKAVTVDGAKRYVNATFMGVSTAGSFSPTGRFVMYASDPFDYQYPQQFINSWLTEEFGTDCFPPEIQADYYVLADEGMLLCYSDNNLEESFKGLLKTAGFTVDTNKDESGSYVAHPNDGSYVVLFKYDADIKALIIKVEAVQGWNASLIKKFYQKYGQQPLSFPSLNIDGASYKFEEDQTNQTYAANGYMQAVHATYTISKTGLTINPLSGYIKTLSASGYLISSVDDTQYYFMKTIADGVFYCASITFDDGQSTGVSKPRIIMDFYATGVSMPGMLVNWPAQQIQSFLGNGLNNSVPAYVGNQCGFKFESNNNHAVISVCIGAGSDSTLTKGRYADLLITNGYTLSNNKYVSSNGEIAITLANPVGQGLYDVFQIGIEKTEHHVTRWPTDDIAAAIATNLTGGISITETIPSFDVENADNCYVNSNMTKEFEIVVEGFASSLDACKLAFTSNSWVEDPFYTFDAGSNMLGAFVSPNNQLVAYVRNVGNDIVIGVKNYQDQAYVEWPSSQINACLAEWEVQNDNIIPSFNSAWYINFRKRENEKAFDISVYSINRELTFEMYQNSLAQAGFEFDNELHGYVTTNKEVLVTLENKTSYISISVSSLIPDPVYKVLGFDNDWSYDSNKAVLFEDASDAEEVEAGLYLQQLKATFHVDADEQFKVSDGSGDEGWFGSEILENNADASYFAKLEGGNIKATLDGTVNLYLRIAPDKTKSLIIAFRPDIIPWPESSVDSILSKWGVSDTIPSITDESITNIEFTPAEDVDEFLITLENGAGLREAYEALLDVNYDYDDGNGFWSPQSTKIAIILDDDGDNLYITVGLSDYIDYELICDNNWDYLAGEAVFYVWVWGGSYGDGQWIEAFYDEGTHSFFLAESIDIKATGMKIVRMNPNAENVPSFDKETVWNETDNIYFSGINTVTVHFSFNG